MREHIPEVRKSHHQRDDLQLIAEQANAPLHLRILSLPRTDTISGLDQTIDRHNYFFDNSIDSKGTWLYILDSGFVINQLVSYIPSTIYESNTYDHRRLKILTIDE